LVLGGGGARGFAHIGVVKALCEAGVPFDYLGGVSMGGIIAAALASEWSLDDLEQRLRAAFVKSHPFTDYTFPLIALVKGRKMTKLLTTNFGKTAIEDMARPFFCISSDLTTGHIHEHRSGPLWRALRASAALPGIVPPVTHHGHLLVDGGVMNNLPVDIMRKRRIGPLIACDVTGEIDFSVRDKSYGEHSFGRKLWQKMAGMPSIFDILMRTGTLGSDAQRRLVRDEADLLIEPPLDGVNPLDWKSFDRAVAEGYAHTARQIENHGLSLMTR
jgi:NTE family protein